jgi:hypothetical protein
MADAIEQEEGFSPNSGLEQPNPTVKTVQPPKEPHFADIVASYRGTQAEWLLTRIIGWHERVTPDRQRDIDNILYLLQAIGYIPEDPVTAPFIALIALVWARLPLTPDLDDEHQTLTAEQIGEQLKKTAKELQWITKTEFIELDKNLDRFFKNDVHPKLDKFDSSIDAIIKRLNEIPAATAKVELDTGKVAETITQQVIATGKRQFEGIYLWMLGLVATLAFYSDDLHHRNRKPQKSAFGLLSSS